MTTTAPTPQLLTMRELAPLLGMSEDATRRLARTGELAKLGLPPIRLAGAYRVRAADLERFLAPAHAKQDH